MKAKSNTEDNKPKSPDYYFNAQGLMVMTEAFHLKRGYCCGNHCKHCPYAHENVKHKKNKQG